MSEVEIPARFLDPILMMPSLDGDRRFTRALWFAPHGKSGVTVTSTDGALLVTLVLNQDGVRCNGEVGMETGLQQLEFLTDYRKRNLPVKITNSEDSLLMSGSGVCQRFTFDPDAHRLPSDLELLYPRPVELERPTNPTFFDPRYFREVADLADALYDAVGGIRGKVEDPNRAGPCLGWIYTAEGHPTAFYMDTGRGASLHGLLMPMRVPDHMLGGHTVWCVRNPG